MHRVVEYTGLRWLYVDPHWIRKALSGSRCLLNQSQVGLFHSALSASARVWDIRLWMSAGVAGFRMGHEAGVVKILLCRLNHL